MTATLAGINDFVIKLFFGQKADSLVGSGLGGSDAVFLFIWWVSVFFFVLLMGIMGYCMVKYRRREGVPAEPSPSHNTPLEIAWSVIDTTVYLDDTPFWQDGRFVFLEREDIRALLADYPGCENAFEMRTDIGL